MSQQSPEEERRNYRRTHEEISLMLINEEKRRQGDIANRREVSCLALNFFYDYLEANGLDRRLIQRDLPYSPEYLDNRVNWIDYETFCTIERRLADHFDDPDLYYKVGCSFQSTGGLGFVRVIMRSVVSPFQVYNVIPRMLKRFLFPNVNAKYTRTARSEMLGRYVFNEGYAPSDAWVETTRGILSSIPTMMGAPPADVVATRTDPLTIEFQVRLHRWLGPMETVRGAFRKMASLLRMRIANLAEAKDELENANSLLQDKVNELTAAKATLSAKVRDLSVLNRLSVQSTGQLDLRKLIRSAVRVISEELTCLPNAVLLARQEAGDLEVAGAAGINGQQLQDLDRQLYFDQMTIDDVCAAENPLVADGWRGYPMRVGDRPVGALLARRVEGDGFDDGLFVSIANQLAVSVDNAQSYQVITDLRDNLELRVKARTAQLEEARSRLEDTVVKLEEADRAKREFFTNVSHELKTPLTLIMAPIDELNREGATPDVVTGLHRNASTLLRLVEEMLDFSRIDDGRMQADPIRFDLRAFTDDLVQSLSPLATQRGITLVFAEGREQVPVDAEPRLVRRVVRNLVTNAIKYIDSGDTVTVTLEPSESAIRLSVSDTGPGIPNADKDRVFERFYRCAETQRQVKGSGIGLAMARDLAELSGGSLTLSDTPGGGATFEFVLPTPVGDAELVVPGAGDDDSSTLLALSEYGPSAPAPVQEGSEHTQRVLVVDDNPEIRALMRRLLSPHYDVVEAFDGADGIDKARDLAPDLILSDVAMPRMNGYEFCRRVKDLAETKNTPVLLVTARHGTEAAVEGFACGADDFVTKPFAPQELLARVEAHIRLRTLTVALIRAEKQSSLGAMSAGIAHQILNPVNVVVNAVKPLGRAVRKLAAGEGTERHAERSAKMLEAIENSGRRISKVVEAVLRLARQDTEGVHFRPTLISDHIDSAVTMLGHRVSRGYEIDLQLGYQEYVECAPDLLDQAVLNLLNNAMDAMPEGGAIVVSTEAVDDSLVIRVSDSGHGVPDALRTRIFNPFFTTKSAGTSAGLGLALVREITALHAGTSTLVSTGPNGSTFELRIPLQQRRRVDPTPATEQEPSPAHESESQAVRASAEPSVDSLCA